MDDDLAHLRRACALAHASATTAGGPFGALVVRDGEVVAEGINAVTAAHDPTAHAEMVAVRRAGEALGTHDLSGCVLYASCHPCPMCLAAAWWARIERVVYGATPAMAASAGFDDQRFWDAMAEPVSGPASLEHLRIDDAEEPFAAWVMNEHRQPY